ncbi:MAG TPA: copper homeostasis protein CutC [Terracidiphilus sp.]|nr:copper homeostasis protein CutC [Terracidiphilus sp.]
MMGKIHFELCAESAGAARIADACGADRVELCENLAAGGTTPPLAMIKDAVASLSIPVHVLIRPRAGDFVYTPEEFVRMKEEIRAAKMAGAAGVVLGVLLKDGRVDGTRSRALVEESRPMRVTFHRAFDETPDPFEALEAVVSTGADWLLTSGGERNVVEGAETLARLARQANGRIRVMVGGGLRLENLVEVVRATGVEWVHGSLQRRESCAGDPAASDSGEAANSEVREEDVRMVMQMLREEAGVKNDKQPAG